MLAALLPCSGTPLLQNLCFPLLWYFIGRPGQGASWKTSRGRLPQPSGRDCLHRGAMSMMVCRCLQASSPSCTLRRLHWKMSGTRLVPVLCGTGYFHDSECDVFPASVLQSGLAPETKEKKTVRVQNSPLFAMASTVYCSQFGAGYRLSSIIEIMKMGIEADSGCIMMRE